ncbi:MAG: response regulator [Deltaproteobacteria bacterium]
MSKDDRTSGEPIYVLIAEDERNISELLEEILAQEGRRIKIAHNGREAIGALEERPFDLLITDLMMPEVDGMELIRRAKALYPDIMVIIMTGYATIETAIQAVKEGAYDYLRKPFRLDEIRISADNACEKIRLMQENKRLLAMLHHAKDRTEGDPSCLLPVAGDENPREDVPIFSLEKIPPSYFQTGAIQAGAALTEFERLGALRQAGHLTDDEFRFMKQKLFSRIS